MKNVFHIALFFILVNKTGLSQDNFYNPKYSTILDSTRGPGVLHQCSRASPQKVKKFWNPAQSDIRSLEKNFKKVLELEATICCCISCPITHFEDYGFQYVGIIIKKKKYIYINAFRIPSEEYLNKYYSYWKTGIVGACDGGSSFWGVLYDIENGTFDQLAFNGVG